MCQARKNVVGSLNDDCSFVLPMIISAGPPSPLVQQEPQLPAPSVTPSHNGSGIGSKSKSNSQKSESEAVNSLLPFE